jgi:hypothetical protein
MPQYCATVNCYNLSNKVRLSFFCFPKEADRYSNADVEIQDISKNMFCLRISLLFVHPLPACSAKQAKGALPLRREPIECPISCCR